VIVTILVIIMILSKNSTMKGCPAMTSNLGVRAVGLGRGFGRFC
jgi:hypothetical protein